MPTSTALSILPEGWPIAEDDRPQREAARVRLLVTQLGPIGRALIDAFPNLHWRAADLKAVLDRYQTLRDEAETLMNGYDEPGHLHVIDRHKIGAAFILAVLDVAPLKLKPDCQATLEGERLANAALAFRTAVRIVGAFARLEGRKKPDPLLLARWQRAIVYPAPRDGNAFLHHAYRALHHGYRQKKLNLPLLAIWLFIIEQYNNSANP